VCQIGLVNICTISTDVTAKEASLRRMTETCAERLLSGRYSRRRGRQLSGRVFLAPDKQISPCAQMTS
jgi:hypothetical protein